MGYLDAFTANTFRADSQGRLVFAPSGRRGKAYIVPPERAASYARFLRWYFALMMVAVIATTFLFGPVVMATIIVPLWFVGYYAKLAHFTRGLQVTTEVPALTRREADVRVMRAMGSRTIATVCLTAAVLTLLGVWMVTHGRGSVPMWLLTGYFALVAVLYAARWRQLRRHDAATLESGAS